MADRKVRQVIVLYDDDTTDIFSDINGRYRVRPNCAHVTVSNNGVTRRVPFAEHEIVWNAVPGVGG